MRKDSYDFETKRLYHEKLKNFILKHHPQERRRRSLNVVCFPAHEALEVKNVYLPLGIRPDRIWGIEHDPTTAQELRSQGLGINVYEGEADQFFKERQGKYDIVNLDFQSQFKDPEMRVLNALNFNHRLESQAILGTNFYGSRENDKIQRGLSADRDMLSNGGHVSLFLQSAPDNNSSKTIQDFNIVKKIREGVVELEDARDKGISLRLKCLSCNNSICEFDTYKPYLPLAVSTNKYPYTVEQIVTNPYAHVEFLHNLFGAVQAWDMARLFENYSQDLACAKSVISYLESSHLVRPYMITDFVKGKYVSDTGSPMLFDFLRMNERKDLFANVSVERDMIHERMLIRDTTHNPESKPNTTNIQKLGDLGKIDFWKALQVSRAQSADEVVSYPGIYVLGNSTAFIKKVNLFSDLVAKEDAYVHAEREELRVPTLGERIRSDYERGLTEAEILQRYTLTPIELGGHKAALKRFQGWSPPPIETEKKQPVPLELIHESDQQPTIEAIVQTQPTSIAMPMSQPLFEKRKLRAREKREIAQAMADNLFSERELMELYEISPMQLAGFKAAKTKRELKAT